MVNDTQATRLNRIEDKLDKLSDAIISLARAEEKLMGLEKFMHQQMDMLVDGQRRLELVEKQVHGNATTINIINKIFWIVMAAAATTVTGMLILQ
jgi:hypothetical protein|tara:strand:+ start:1004 stop:1288 length:285 start_codon:yes stop_codon:yes gene_type:complete